MPITSAFLTTCRNAISSLAELTAFRSALSTLSSAARSSRISAWHAAYSPTTTAQSLAYQLRIAIRGVIDAQADIAGTLSGPDRQSAYDTLSSEFVPVYPKPPTDAEVTAELQRLLLEEQLS